MDGIEAVEEHSDRTWEAALAALILLENRLKRRLVRRIAELPETRLGRLERRSLRRFRSFVRHEVDAFVTEGSLRLAGVPRANVVAVPRGGLQRAAVFQAMRITDEALDRAGLKEASRGADAGSSQARSGARGAGATSLGVDAEGTRRANRRDDLGPVGDPIRARRDRAAADFEDVMLDAVENPPRQFAYEGHRVAETVKRLATRHGSRAEAIRYVEGDA